MRAFFIAIGYLLTFVLLQFVSYFLARLWVLDMGVLLFFSSLTVLVGMGFLAKSSLSQLSNPWKNQRLWWQVFAAWAAFAVLVQLLGGYFEQSPMDFMDGLITADNRWFVLVAVVVLAPIGEELVFRGLIFEQLAKINPPTALIGSSALFALVHLQYNWFGFLAIFVLALLLCYARMASGGLALSMVLHGINNATAMVIYCLDG